MEWLSQVINLALLRNMRLLAMSVTSTVAAIIAILALETTSAYSQTYQADTETKTAATRAPMSKLCPAANACLAALDADVGAPCEPFPVPANARPTGLRKQGYNLTELRPGLYSYYDGVYFTVLARSDKVVVAVDFPESTGTIKSDGSGTRVTDAVEEIMHGDVPDTIYMIYSHPHSDHVR
jgi:hypothetical protein